MGNRVNMVAIKYLNDRRWDGDPERSVDVSVRLTEGQRAKLRFLAERFGDSDEVVASRLLDGAMEDALRVLGSHDYGTEEWEALSADDQNRVIDGRVSVYREEIRDILEEGSA